MSRKTGSLLSLTFAIILSGCMTTSEGVMHNLNAEVTADSLNLQWRYCHDQFLYGELEHWNANPPFINGKFVGDCEDYALKLQSILKRGRVAVVTVHNLGDHAVFVDNDGRQYEVGRGQVPEGKEYEEVTGYYLMH